MALNLSKTMTAMMLDGLARRLNTTDGPAYQVATDGKWGTAKALQKRCMLVMDTRTVVGTDGTTLQATGAWLTESALNVLCSRLMKQLEVEPQERDEMFDAFLSQQDKSQAAASYVMGAVEVAEYTVITTLRSTMEEARTTMSRDAVQSELAGMIRRGRVLPGRDGVVVGKVLHEGELTEVAFHPQDGAMDLDEGMTLAELDAEIPGAAMALHEARYEGGRQGRVYGPEEVTGQLHALQLAKYVPGHFRHQVQLVLTESGADMAEQEQKRRSEEAAVKSGEYWARRRPVEERDLKAKVISDELLGLWEESSSQGELNSVEALRPLTPEQRYVAEQEARAFVNVTPGWTFSGAVWEAAKNVPLGRTPGLDRAAQLLAHDPDGTKAEAHAARGGDWAGFVSEAERGQEGAQQAVGAPESAVDASAVDADAFDGIGAEAVAEAVGEARLANPVEDMAGQAPMWRVLDGAWKQVGLVHGETHTEAVEAGRRDLGVQAAARRGAVTFSRLRRFEVWTEAEALLPDGESFRVTEMTEGGGTERVMERAGAVGEVAVRLMSGARVTMGARQEVGPSLMLVKARVLVTLVPVGV